MNDKPDAAAEIPAVTTTTIAAPEAPTVVTVAEPATAVIPMTAALGADSTSATHAPVIVLNITNSPVFTNSPTSSSETKLVTGGAAANPTKLHLKFIKSPAPENEAGFAASVPQKISIVPIAPSASAAERVEAQPAQGAVAR